jgi:hypothetical protein
MRLLPTHPALAVLCLASTTAAQAQTAPPKPGDETPRADITRQAPGAVERPLKEGLKPLTPQGPLAAPTNPQPVRPMVGQDGGTQGRPYVQFNRTAKPMVGTKSRATGDEDEMDDLDIQRRKAQGLPENKPGSPQPKDKPGSEQPRGERRQ